LLTDLSTSRLNLWLSCSPSGVCNIFSISNCDHFSGDNSRKYGPLHPHAFYI
jgi:hypothetical protein